MASIINADTSNGLKLTSDTTGQLDFQSAGSTKATIDTAGNLKFDSGYGSVATGYGCRAWVNFDGTGTIRDSGNVSSITDNGTGDYTVNFTTAMPDANYSIAGGGNGQSDLNPACLLTAGLTENNTVSSARVSTTNSSNASKVDYTKINVQIFR